MTRHAQTPPCPACGHRWELAAGYLIMKDKAHQALCRCETHGLYTVRIQFQKSENGRREMVRTCALTEEQSPAYISTKILQWQNKLAAQKNEREAKE